MLDTKQLGKRIASLRKQNGMSQEKLAELLCISPQAVSKWENGHTMPVTSLLPVLAQIFQCSVDEIIMPAYLVDPDIMDNAKKKPDRLELLSKQIADYIIQQLNGAVPEEIIGLEDAAIIEAVRRVHPNLGNFQIKRGSLETHNRYMSVYITVTTDQQELHLLEKVYQGNDKELFGYELFSQYTTAIPQIYFVDFDKKILLMEDLTGSIQGIHFDQKNKKGNIFRENYFALMEETAEVHAAFWEREDIFRTMGFDPRHRTTENLLAHIGGMEQDFLAYRKKEESGKIPKVWNGLRNSIEADKLDYFQDAIRFMKRRYVPLIEERFHTGKNITVIHGDLHPGNIFISKSPGSFVKMIDMEAVRVGFCTEDLAMLLALHIEPDQERVKPLLDYYYECLCWNVKGYSYEMFMDDYRISVAEAMFFPVRLINCGICDFVMRDRAIRAYESFVADHIHEGLGSTV